MDYSKIKEAFERYIDSYDRNDKKIHLKYAHSYQVSDLMAELAFRLGMDKEEVELAKTIGLLHDIGRFEQIQKFSTIDDATTHMDHALESCCYLFDKYHIRDFIEDSKYDMILKDAILNHNKLKVGEVSEESSIYVKMIRDMDKVDIYRSLAVNYEMKFCADEIKEEVLKQFSEKRLIDNNITVSDSEKIIKYLSYVYDFNFNESLDILVHSDNFDLFLSTVEVDESSEKLWKKLRECCFDKINEGVVNHD